MNREGFTELASLIQIYLLQEYSPSDWIYAEGETYAFFKAMESGRQKKGVVPKTPPQPLPVSMTPQKTPSTPLPPSQEKIEKKAEEKEMIKTEPPKLTPSPEGNHLKPSSFKLERMDPPKPLDFSHIRSVIHEQYPHIKIIDEIPPDSISKSTAKIPLDQLQAIVLSSTNSVFLNNLARAIDYCLAPAAMMDPQKFEKQNWELLLKSENLKLLIITHQELTLLPQLEKHFNRGQDRCFFETIPAIILNDIDLFLKDPLQKKALWMTISTRLTQRQGDGETRR